MKKSAFCLIIVSSLWFVFNQAYSQTKSEQIYGINELAMKQISTNANVHGKDLIKSGKIQETNYFRVLGIKKQK